MSLLPKARLATRGSKLALWQTRFVSSLLARHGVTSEEIVVSTQGDRVQDRFLHEIGGKGLFIRELEDALIKDRADLAIHSMKDLPANIPAPFALPAVLPRHSPRDLLIFRSEVAKRFKLPQILTREDARSLGSLSIATASLRRQALWKALGTNVTLVAMRGNVDTRLRKLEEGAADALILAEAAMDRLDLKKGLHAVPLDPSWFVPSPAQGALAIEALPTNRFCKIAAMLNDDVTAACVKLERGILADLGGDCTMPLGCHVFWDAGRQETFVRAQVMNYEGRSAEVTLTYPGEPRELPQGAMRQAVIAGLESQGLASILADLARTPPPKLEPSAP